MRLCGNWEESKLDMWRGDVCGEVIMEGLPVGWNLEDDDQGLLL